MPMPSCLLADQVSRGRARTGNIKYISLLVACLQDSDVVQKYFKISRNIQIWRPAVADPA